MGGRIFSIVGDDVRSLQSSPKSFAPGQVADCQVWPTAKFPKNANRETRELRELPKDTYLRRKADGKMHG